MYTFIGQLGAWRGDVLRWWFTSFSIVWLALMLALLAVMADGEVPRGCANELVPARQPVCARGTTTYSPPEMADTSAAALRGKSIRARSQSRAAARAGSVSEAWRENDARMGDDAEGVVDDMEVEVAGGAVEESGVQEGRQRRGARRGGEKVRDVEGGESAKCSGGRKCQKFQGGESAKHSQGGENSRGRIFQNLEGGESSEFFRGEKVPRGDCSRGE